MRPKRKPTPKSEVSNQTGPCYSHKKGSCLQDNNFDCWHPFICVFHTRGHCISGTNCPFVHISKHGQSPSPRRQPKPDKHEVGEKPLQVPTMGNIPAPKNLKRRKATGVEECVWSHDMKVAFQEAHPSRNVRQRVRHERILDSDLKVREYQEKQARFKAWKLHTELCKTEGAHADMHRAKLFKGFSTIEEANTSKPRPIIKSKDRMYIVDTGASLHMMEESSTLSAGRESIRQTKNYLEIHTANGSVYFSKEAIDYIRELWSLGRCCDELGCSYP